MTLENHAQTEDRTITFKSPVREVEGNKYMTDVKGSLVPVELVKDQDKLEDDTVRRVIAFAHDLSAQVARFHGHCFEDIGALEALIAEKYDAKLGGRKGNMTLMSYDGTMKIQVQVADHIDFGSELQTAKSLIDECLIEWSADSRPEIRALITSAFNTDREGQVNRADIFMLLRMKINDERWQKAMEAIRDAMRVVGSKTYIRFYQRENGAAKWQAITIDLAKV